MLKATFSALTDLVVVDAIFDDDDIGVLTAYDSSGQVLQQVTGSGDGRGSVPFATLTIDRATRDIAFVIAGGFNTEGIYLDNLRFDIAPVPVPSSLVLMVVGLGLLGFMVRHRKPQAGIACCGSRI
jgi:hypothetical protein